ncbi:hypothetical protein KUCAC02_032585, partial [Chaenocephalus aceratus]
MADKDACREYLSSLEDLTFNSKPHINMLTILAEENLHFAKENRPVRREASRLYLVDSIVKNVGGEYLAVFAKNLITSFICVFEKVDENTRKSLFKLRSTWEDVFPLRSSTPSTSGNASIHVNPKFLKQATPPAPHAPPPALVTPRPLLQPDAGVSDS